MIRQPGPNMIRARMFSEAAHAGQTYDKYPYTYHLEQTTIVQAKFGFDDQVSQCAGWLHDCIEDTRTSYNDIKDEFGFDVAELVYAVTNELGRTREERNTRTHPKIRGNVMATGLKLADRMTHCEHGAINGGKFETYKKEAASFELGIRTPAGEPEDERLTRMWLHMGRLLGVSVRGA